MADVLLPALIGAVGGMASNLFNVFLHKNKYNREEDQNTVNRAGELIAKIRTDSISYWLKDAPENNDLLEESQIKDLFEQLQDLLYKIKSLDSNIDTLLIDYKRVVQLGDFESTNRKKNEELAKISIPESARNLQNKITDAYELKYKKSLLCKSKHLLLLLPKVWDWFCHKVLKL